MKLGFITLTNLGYLEYTKNCIKSLEQIGVEGLKVYCIDQESFDKLDYDRKLMNMMYYFKTINKLILMMVNYVLDFSLLNPIKKQEIFIILQILL